MPQRSKDIEDQLIIDYVNKANNKWDLAKIQLTHENTEVIAKWKHKLENIMSKFAFNKPKNLLIFINPFGGKGEAIRIHSTIVQPLFKQFNVQSEVIITQRANHAKDFLQENSLINYDGIVCIGGDGMFAEIFNGLLIHSCRQNGQLQDMKLQKNLSSPKLRFLAPFLFL